MRAHPPALHARPPPTAARVATDTAAADRSPRRHRHARSQDLGPRTVARIAHLALLLALLALVINLVVSIGLMLLGAGAAVHVMYAAFNLILAFAFGTWTLMTGYKGIATNQSKLMRRYLTLWGILSVGMAIASLINLLNFNGWARVMALLETPAADKVQPLWLWGSIIESSVWSSACLVSFVAWCLVYRINDRGPAAVRWNRGNRL